MEFNKYDSETIVNLLNQLDINSLNKDDKKVINEFNSRPILTIDNMYQIASLLGISIEDLLSKQEIKSEDYLNKLGLGNSNKEGMDKVLKLMIVFSKQLNLNKQVMNDE